MHNLSDPEQEEHFQILRRTRWGRKMCVFQPISRRISKKVKDRATVAIDHWSEVP